ncbi:chromosome segregation ATPase [Thermacetogenium phaeum DSM 12270]|uniref:Chromosome segregation ATPase n=1 Tax=Thermacetogenium phaeum (strain ATCC BAA-254 / DSM 26808 / PB) TaxID=1089553 RepID=K4LSX0_THEPS|nr:ATPase [Thermacetogenium phaeum]AFV11159.1 chromosome segregation ATPase [Thermacetogenium phaeum DSM 12270]
MKQDLNALKKALEELKAVYHRQRGEQAKILEEEKVQRERLAQVKDEGECLEQVRLLLLEAARHAREQGRRQVEYLVSQALQFVFGGDVEFKVEVEEKRDRPEAEFYVCSTYGGNYRVETPPQDARGGGVVDVISLALRLALLHAFRPPVGGPAVLDEPGKHVSEEYAPQLARFLKSFSQSLGRQVIMVSHNQHLADTADIAYLVEMQHGASRVRRIR